MAQYKHLPIYKTTYDLLAHVTQITKSFPKDFKHSLAARLREECVSLVVFIYKANAARHARGEWIESILERMQVIELLLRLSKDMRFISVKQFSDTVLLTDSIGRQAQGWLKSQRPSAE
jgi:hypothetical protein